VGPWAADVEIVKETEKRELETAAGQNAYWLNSLQAMHLFGRDPRRILRRIDRTESLTTENIHAVLRKYLSPDRYTVVTLMPEVTAGPLVTR
jgi:predicted Zn-dependent peptidase